MHRRGFAPVFFILIVAAALVLGGGIFYYVQKKSGQPAPIVPPPSILPTPSSTASVATSTNGGLQNNVAESNFYRNYDCGFEVTGPADWYLRKKTAGINCQVEFDSLPESAYSEGGVLPSGGAEISIVAKESKTLGEELRSMQQGLSADEIGTTSTVTVDGRETIETNYNIDYGIHRTVVFVPERGWYVFAYSWRPPDYNAKIAYEIILDERGKPDTSAAFKKIVSSFDTSWLSVLKGIPASYGPPTSTQPLGRNKIIITSISPDSGPVGTVIMLGGSGWGKGLNIIHFGDGVDAGGILHGGCAGIGALPPPGSPLPGSKSGCDVYDLSSIVQSSYQHWCILSKPPCDQPDIATKPGRYSVWVSTEDGRSNEVKFTVTPGVAPTSGNYQSRSVTVPSHTTGGGN